MTQARSRTIFHYMVFASVLGTVGSYAGLELTATLVASHYQLLVSKRIRLFESVGNPSEVNQTSTPANSWTRSLISRNIRAESSGLRRRRLLTLVFTGVSPDRMWQESLATLTLLLMHCLINPS